MRHLSAKLTADPCRKLGKTDRLSEVFVDANTVCYANRIIKLCITENSSPSQRTVKFAQISYIFSNIALFAFPIIADNDTRMIQNVLNMFLLLYKLSLYQVISTTGALWKRGHGPPALKNCPIFGNFNVASENLAVGNIREGEIFNKITCSSFMSA